VEDLPAKHVKIGGKPTFLPVIDRYNVGRLQFSTMPKNGKCLELLRFTAIAETIRVSDKRDAARASLSQTCVASGH